MSKALKIKIVAVLTNLLPPLGVCIWQFPIIISRTESTISFAAMLIIVLFLAFAKDEVKQYITSPTVFTLSVVFLILGYIGMTLGEQFLIIGLTTVTSSVISTPLYMWSKNEKEGNKQIDLLNTLKGLVSKDESDNEKH